jgi:hypothetical protein
VAWLVGVCAATDGHADRERIECLYQANGINVRMLRRQDRQPAGSRLTMLGCKYQGSFAPQVGREFRHSGSGGIRRCE